MEGLLNKLGADTFSMYVFDYEAPVGFRLFSRKPERLEALIVQNGNAYEEGLRDFWDPLPLLRVLRRPDIQMTHEVRLTAMVASRSGDGVGTVG